MLKSGSRGARGERKRFRCSHTFRPENSSFGKRVKAASSAITQLGTCPPGSCTVIGFSTRD